jgi:hypothetical protein
MQSDSSSLVQEFCQKRSSRLLVKTICLIDIWTKNVWLNKMFGQNIFGQNNVKALFYGMWFVGKMAFGEKTQNQQKVL